MGIPALLFIVGAMAVVMGVAAIGTVLVAGGLACAVAVVRQLVKTGSVSGLGSSLLFRSGVAIVAGAAAAFLAAIGIFAFTPRPPGD